MPSTARMCIWFGSTPAQGALQTMPSGELQARSVKYLAVIKRSKVCLFFSTDVKLPAKKIKQGRIILDSYLYVTIVQHYQLLKHKITDIHTHKSCIPLKRLITNFVCSEFKGKLSPCVHKDAALRFCDCPGFNAELALPQSIKEANYYPGEKEKRIPRVMKWLQWGDERKIKPSQIKLVLSNKFRG